MPAKLRLLITAYVAQESKLEECHNKMEQHILNANWKSKGGANSGGNETKITQKQVRKIGRNKTQLDRHPT
jgi:hypothetical protein